VAYKFVCTVCGERCGDVRYEGEGICGGLGEEVEEEFGVGVRKEGG